MDEIINRVANSSLITLDLEDLVDEKAIQVLDFKDFLHEEIMLKEKEFRQQVLSISFDAFPKEDIYLIDDTDAIIPQWAYMFISAHCSSHQKELIRVSNKIDAIEKSILYNLKNKEIHNYENQKVIVKGCSKWNFSPNLYVEIGKILQPQTQSLLFGEACSSVPIYKRRN